jgi:hypothetical protein
MSRTAVQVLDQALRLPRGSRAFVAEKLLESLDAETDAALDPAWIVEVRRRAGQIDRAEVALIPAEKAFAEAFEALR